MKENRHPLLPYNMPRGAPWGDKQRRVRDFLSICPDRRTLEVESKIKQCISGTEPMHGVAMTQALIPWFRDVALSARLA